ncbi:hypothetical protein H8356DRAFT_1624085 [Neocallimastix lanati (nom. inval.)]|nr:hypothetical protein H8356DRAFT_1624085 [Neocallimastix sp. JGI-2020a]
MHSTVSSVSVSKEFPDITVLSNSDVGYDDISTVTSPTLSTVNQSSIMASRPISKSYNNKPELSTLKEASHEESSHEIEKERSVYTTDVDSDTSSPICNPDSILMSENFSEENYLPNNITPIGDEQDLKMKRSNSLTKVRKNILMRPRELFPRSASLKSLQRREENVQIPQPLQSLSQSFDEANNSLSNEKDQKSVNESLDNLLVQLEKIKNDKLDDSSVMDKSEIQQPSFTERNDEVNNISQSDISFKRSDKQRLIISNLERKTPEPVVWGVKSGETNNGYLQVEKNAIDIDTNSIHIETEETTLSEYTENRYTSEPENIQVSESSVKESSTKEFPIKESSLKESPMMMNLTPKSSIEKIAKRNDSEVKSIKSFTSSSAAPTKPKSVLQERERKNNIKGSLSPSLLSSSAWQYFNSKKEDHRVIHPSQTPTSLGNSPAIYKSPKLHKRNRSINNSRIVPPMMSPKDIGKSPSISNEPSSLRKVDSIDNVSIKPPSILTSRSNSLDSNSVKESTIKKLGKLVRNASMKASPKSTSSKPLYIISPALSASKVEASPLVKEEKMTSSPTTGKFRRRVPPEKESKSKNLPMDMEKDMKVKNATADDKVSMVDTEVSSHSLLPSFSFNETPLSIEICNALVQDSMINDGKDESTLDLYNALNNKNSQVVNPSNKQMHSHRRSMPRPRSVIKTVSSRKGSIDEEEENGSDVDSNVSEKQSIVLVSPSGLQKYSMVKQSKENVTQKENHGDRTIGMENGLKLENGRLEVTVSKDQELNELAEKLLMEGGDKNFKSYYDQSSYIITPDKKKKKGEFLRNSLKIFKRKSVKTPLISSPELISFSNNNGNMETYPLNNNLPMKLGNDSSELEEKNNLPSTSGHNKNIHLTPIHKTSINTTTSSSNIHSPSLSPTSPTSQDHSDNGSDIKHKRRSHKIGRIFGKKK